VPVTVTDEEFALLCEFFDRWSTASFDPKFVGQTVKRGEKLMRRLEEISKETYGQSALPGVALLPPA
jgi:hypothetical protein